jgi:ferredoxin
MPHRDTLSHSTPRALAPGVTPLGWLSSRCLQAPPHPLACSRCLDACPAEALAFHEDGDGGVALLASEACHGCGQCVAACPSEALVSAEVDALVAGQAEGEALQLGCHRVQGSVEFTRLHCLRTLGPDLLAWLAARTAPEAVTLYLPDGCRDCPAAPQDARDIWRGQAEALATVADTPAHRDFRTARTAVSRRDLLRGRPAPRLPSIPADDAAPKARRLQRRLAAADALASLVAPELPGLSLDAGACRAHGVCARVCPTEALRDTPDGDLVFDPLACLDCGHCRSACPEQALEMGRSMAPVAVTLRQGLMLECFDCHRPFRSSRSEAGPDSPRCPACRREAALLQESFHDLFG